MTQTKTINQLLLSSIGKYCDFKIKDGEQGSGIIKSAGSEIWVSYGHKEECAVDACDIIEVSNIQD